MLFSSIIFVFAFLPIVLAVYYGIFKKSRTWQNITLTVASLFFYAWGEPKFVLVMLLSIIMNWFFALCIDKNRHSQKIGKIMVGLSVACNLGILFIFKYLNFTLQNINNIGISVPVTSIALPIGISFFTFQAMSYVIDVYRCNGAVQKNPMNIALYIAFFPQLIAGPIVRYQTVADEIHNRVETFEDFSTGVSRFAVGFCKKVLFSNTFALIADAAFNADGRSTAFAWVGAIAYTLQIFYDFSGYSDMGIGLGRMFGFHFLENFDYPYISRSISEFWRRWHMSLGSWFRDYVYFPLGGSRVKTKSRLVFNLFAVWFLTGVWHGANWTFIIWGLIYFVLITLEKLTGFAEKLKGFGTVYTLFFVVMGWVLFRAESLSSAIAYMKDMFGFGSMGLMCDKVIFYLSENKFEFIFAILFCVPVVKYIPEKIKNSKTANIVYPVVLMSLFVFAISCIVKGSYNPFIYFNF